MKGGLSYMGGIVTALLASACCIGPALFIAFGVTGLGFLTGLQPLRPYMLGASFIFLGLSWRKAYGRKCEEGSCSPGSLKISRALFWIVAATVVFGLAFPYVAGWLLV